MDNSAHKTTSKVSSLSITVGRAKIKDHIYIHPSHNSTAYIPPPLGIDISSTLRILLQNLHGLQMSTLSYSNNIAHTKNRDMCLPETNIHWADTRNIHDNCRLFRKCHRAFKAQYSSQLPADLLPSSYLPGGTATIISLGCWTRTVMPTTADSSAMGRWSGIILKTILKG